MQTTARKQIAAIALLFAAVTAQASPGRYAIATAHPAATEAGAKTLDAGGNAFDAAVAVAAMLAVVEPYSSGIGGGGFWLVHRAPVGKGDGKEVMLDGRERAPYSSHRDLFLDSDGDVIPRRSVDGVLAAGIPGLPAALVHLAKHYGRLPLAATLKPAIETAERGFPAGERLIRLLKQRLDAIRASPASAEIFLVNGAPPNPGRLIRQPELAEVLRRITAHGADGFYRGEIAAKLVAGVAAAGGAWQARDLAEYTVVERTPIRFAYRGARITSAAPPSSGGVVMAEIFNILSHFDLSSMDRTEKVHYLVEAMNLAYRDRARHLGDPDFVRMPIAELISPEYAAKLAKTIAPTHVPGTGPGHDRDNDAEGRNTTHYSIVDAAGNRVAATLSINYAFGSGATVAGVLLNNEMDDFVAKPGVANLYGLVGGEANSIEPGKRMLSSMSPTFVDDGQRLAVLGTPGGSRIITMVALAILDFLDGADAETIVSGKRFHHQYLPDEIQFEPGAFGANTQQQLQARGHRLKPLKRNYGNMQIVIWNRKSNSLSAASDSRGFGNTRIR